MYSLSSGAKLYNSIVWLNLATGGGADGIDFFTGMPTVRESDIQGGFSGAGNINLDPKFVNAGQRNYQLKASSPCVDTGDEVYLPNDILDLDGDGITTLELIPWDLLGGDRVNLVTVDMGAYEKH